MKRILLPHRTCGRSAAVAAPEKHTQNAVFQADPSIISFILPERILRSCTSSTPGSLLVCPVPLTKNSLQHLTGAALRELSLGELDAARNLVIGQSSSAMGEQVIDGKSFSRF